MANYIRQKPYYLNVPAGRPAGLLASIPQTSKTRSSMGIMDILGSGFGAISSIGSMIGQNRAIRQQIKAQQQENQKNREYNLMLAQTQNRWNIDQWQRENDYNSPTAQMARFRAAGLNPNLIYGQMSNGASSPTLTSGAASSPTDMSAIGNKRNFGQAMQEMLNMEMQKAQIEAIKAGTEKTKADTDNTRETTKGLTIDNMYRAAQHEQTLEIGGMQIKLGKSTLKLNEQQMENLKAQLPEIAAKVENINQSTAESRRRVQQMDLDEQRAAAREIREQAMHNVTLQQVYNENRKILAEAKISEQQFAEMVATEAARSYGLFLDNRGKEIANNNAILQGINVDYNNQLIRYDAEYQRELNDKRTSVMFGNEHEANFIYLACVMLDGVNRVVQVINPFKKR